MNNRNTHIARIDINIDENGIQFRNGDPSSLTEGQIWWNDGDNKAKVYDGTNVLPIYVDIVDGDLAAPVDGDIWINSQTNQLKVVDGGITIEINPIDNALTSNIDANQYGEILTEEELVGISDINTKYPTYLIDSFQGTQDNVTLTNAEVSANRLQIAENSTIGTYEREKRLSSNADFADGIAVVTTQPYAPSEILDTETIKFYGDVTAELTAGIKLICYNDLTVDGYLKQMYLLDTDGNVAKLDIISSAYDSAANETTVIISNVDLLDITRGFVTAEEQFASVRFTPANIKVEAGANGLSGVLAELEIFQAYSDDRKRVLGETVSNALQRDANYNGSIYDIAAAASPSGQYVLIQAKTGSTRDDTITGAPSPYMIYYYSTDGMQTLNRADYKTPTAPNLTQAYAADHNPQGRVMGIAGFRINDEGKFFAPFPGYIPKTAGFYQGFGVFGKIDGNTFQAAPLATAPGNSYPGWINNHDDTSISFTIMNAATEWDNGYLITESIYTSGTGHDQIYNWWKLDFDNMTSVSYGHRWGNAASTNNWHLQMYPSLMEWAEFEGELQCLFGSTLSGGQFRMWKFSASEMFQDGYPWSNPNTNGLPKEHSAFADAPVGGSRAATTAIKTNATTMWLDSYHLDRDEGVLHINIWDDSAALFYINLDLARTSGRVDSIYELTFDVPPTTGNIEIQLDSFAYAAEATPTSAVTAILDTSVSVGAFANNLQIAVNDAVATMTGWAAADYAVVTALGSTYEDGFEINFETNGLLRNSLTSTYGAGQGNSVPMVLSIFSNTTLATPSLNATQVGAYPKWLYNSVGQTHGYDKTNGTLTVIERESNAQWDYQWSTWSPDQDHQHCTQRMATIGKTVYSVATFHSANAVGSGAARQVYFMKNPDFTKTIQSTISYFPSSNASIYASYPSGGAAYGDGKIACEFSVGTTLPYLNGAASGNQINISTYYDDGMMPLRTLSLPLIKSSSTYVHNPNYSVRIKITNSQGGLPNESSVLGYSNKIKMCEISSPGSGECYVYFNFDNIKLPTSDIYFWVLEILDENDNVYIPSQSNDERDHNVLVISTSGGTSGLVYKDGSWSSSGVSPEYRMYDTYIMEIPNAQNNLSAHRFRSVHENQGHWDNIMPQIRMADSGARRLNVAYRSGGWLRNSVTTETGWYANYNSICYGGEIYDPTIEGLPTFSKAKVIGYGDNQVDTNTKYQIALGTEETRTRSPRDVDLIHYDYLGNVDSYAGTGNTDYYDGYNFEHSMGGGRINAWSHDTLKAHKNSLGPGGSDLCVHDDTRFLYDRCAEFNLGYIEYRRYSHLTGMTIGCDEFCLELEYDPMFHKYATHSSDTANGNYYGLFQVNDALVCGVRNGSFFMRVDRVINNDEHYQADELVADEYQRVRFGRSNSTGLFIQVSNDEGKTWNDLTLTSIGNGTPTDYRDWANGRAIGDYDGTYDYFRIGGTTHAIGRIGYIKYLVGPDASVPKTDGVQIDFKPVLKPYILGDGIYSGNKVTQSASYGIISTDMDVSMIQDIVISNKVNDKSSKVSGFDHIFKYRNNVPNGQKAALKITLSKSDGYVKPPYVQGVLINYQNNN